VFQASHAKGVGLFLTKAQVEGMGGTITVESMVDVGTKFEIIFKKLQYG
jgi:signal transduction histidine kinase